MTIHARCTRCGEPLTLEMEADVCVDCLADAAKVTRPEPIVSRLLTRAEIDQICGVSHRRRTA